MDSDNVNPMEQTPEQQMHMLLCSNLVDKLVAWSMALIGLWFLWLAVEEKRGLPLILLLGQGMAHNLLLLVRHPPRRITLHPMFWLVPVLGAHWHVLYAVFRAHEGRAVIPEWTANALSITGSLLFIWARLALGRNFGMVPAEREIIASGPYRWIRHPIYTASLTMGLGYHLGNFSLLVCVIWTSGLAIMVVKALMEEKFLAVSRRYAEYRSKVRWRFLPYLF